MSTLSCTPYALSKTRLRLFIHGRATSIVLCRPEMIHPKTSHVQPDGILQLDDWLPYQCSIVTNRVSALLRRMYTEEYDIGVAEWRLIANLAAHAPLSSKELAEHTALDQVAVTRAISALVQKRLVSRKVDAADRRKVVLRLSKKGMDAYANVAPLAKAIEAELTGGLSAKELAQIRSAMDLLVSAAKKFLHDTRDWRDVLEAGRKLETPPGEVQT